jgi:hypothetical protein
MILARSILIGLVTMSVTSFVSIIGWIVWLSRSLPPDESSGGGDVGWDLVSMYQNCPHKLLLLTVPAVGFAIGFLLSYGRLLRR